MKILICPDSFKGSLSSKEATGIISRTLRKLDPQMDIIALPLADGGEGTSEVIGNNYPEKHFVDSKDALGNNIRVNFLSDSTKKKAFIESAEIIGLPLIPYAKRDPMEASSFGLGMVIKEVMEQGYIDVSIALGGSAVCDGGMGMLEALGYRFLDKNNIELNGKGKNLLLVHNIDDKNAHNRIKETRFKAICDVENPLLGKNGAAFVFSPQKGAKLKDVPILDAGLKTLVETGEKICRGSRLGSIKKGAGAAGGLGYAMMTYLKAAYVSGIDFIKDTVGFKELVSQVDYIITGEGKIDRQSLMGKVISGVLITANQFHKPVIGLGGIVEDKKLLISSGLKAVYEISKPELSIEENMVCENAFHNMEETVKKIYEQFLSHFSK
ncbi:MAG: glycerate kinase [Muribaculaceae bacterium]|nr:glycerate kinase [Muribaculaceae bacterium]